MFQSLNICFEFLDEIVSFLETFEFLFDLRLKRVDFGLESVLDYLECRLELIFQLTLLFHLFNELEVLELL